MIQEWHGLKADTDKPRVYALREGAYHVGSFVSNDSAYSYYLLLGDDVRAAYRAAGDTTPVEEWDLVTP